MHVVLDANAIIRDYRMRGRAGRRLLPQARAGDISLYVPEVVLAEVVKHFRADVQSAAAMREKSDATSSRVIVDAPEQPQLDVNELVEEYERQLREILNDAGAAIVSPSVSHGVLGARAVARHKPFKKSGAGYQDALIWELVRELAATDEVVLVSDNKDDFGGDDDGGIDAFLADELERGGLGGRVTRLPSIPAFIAAHSPHADEHQDELAARLDRDRPYLDAVSEEIRELLLRDGAAELDAIGAIADDVNTIVEEVTLNDVGLLSVNDIGDGSFYASFSVEGDVLLEFPMLESEGWSAFEDGALEDYSVDDPEDHIGTARMRTSFEATVDADYDPNQGTFTSWEISDARLGT